MIKQQSHPNFFNVTILASLIIIQLPISAFADDCTAVCAEYKSSVVGNYDSSAHGSHGDGDQRDSAQMSMAYATAVCGSPNGTQTASGAGTQSGFAGQSGQASGQGGSGGDLANQPIDLGYTTGNTDWDTCFSKLVTRWNVLAQHCAAIDLMGTAQTEELITAITYSVASAACAVACVFPAATGACMVGDAAAVAADVGGDIIIADESHKFSAADWAAGIGSPILAAGSGVVTWAGMGGFNSYAGHASACTAMGLAIVATGIKWLAYASEAGTIDQECKTIGAMNSPFVVPSGTPSPTPTATAPASSDNSRQTPAGSVGRSGGGGSTGTTVSGRASRQFGNTKAYPPAQYAAGSAGSIFGGVLSSIQNLKDLPAQLQAAGIDTGALAKAVASGQTVGSFLGNSGLDGISQVATALDKVQKDITNGKVQFLDSTGKPYAGTSGGKAAAKVAAKPNPFAALAAASSGLGGTTAETTFEKVKREIASDESSDIWHEGFGGSIFQIVSRKLDKAHERVDQLEWDTPLNRAMVGLPAKKPTPQSLTTRFSLIK